MSSFEVVGGKKLSGTIYPQGAKNEALQIICAVLLSDQKITLNNVPDIIAVHKLIDLLIKHIKDKSINNKREEDTAKLHSLIF